MQSSSVIKVGVVCINVHILRHLLKELAIAVDTWLHIISYIILFITVYHLKNKTVLNLKPYCMHCYVVVVNVL